MPIGENLQGVSSIKHWKGGILHFVESCIEQDRKAVWDGTLFGYYSRVPCCVFCDQSDYLNTIVKNRYFDVTVLFLMGIVFTSWTNMGMLSILVQYI